ncbi:MAG: hypothetical protein CVV41_17500 [Candidatus Riflebacteria bacterium HGW-Riflebacteria-1]|jgi:hypothetical protein|nr:MAG: hypothetical protein CVV41_17500 [Candidatus Riflebacteria bacterium HGW-Riflebacteria-1]
MRNRMLMLSQVVFFILIFCLELTVAGVCSSHSEWDEMIEKYGPVPKEILEPLFGEEEEMRQNDSVVKQILRKVDFLRITRPTHMAHSCISRQDRIMHAINFYNSDNSDLYKELNPSDLVDPESPLLKGKYLESKIVNVDDNCVLRSYGDLSELGIIYCEYHGIRTAYQNSARAASEYTPKVGIQRHPELLVIWLLMLGLSSLLLVYRVVRFLRKAS